MRKNENIYLAYLEEKCHIHPTLPVRFDLEADYNLGTSRISCVVGGFDCGICFTDSDILQWLIEKDIKPSELKEYIKKENQKIGELYDDGNIKGIICAVDENDNPKLIMSLESPAKTMTWDEAMEYNKTLRGGWHIPSMEELETIWHDNGSVTKILNRGLKKYNGVLLDNNDYYWSSSEYNRSYAYSVDTYDGNIRADYKDNNRYVRPVVSFF